MEVQVPLCSSGGVPLGRWLAVEALDAMESRYAEWLANRGVPALVMVAQREELFTSDDVWEQLVGEYRPSPRERRVMGCLFRRAAMAGLIVKTEVVVKSRMPECHAREKSLWRSLVYVRPVVVPVFDRDVAPVVPGSGD